MKYLLIFVALAVGAQSGTPPPSSNAATLRGKGPCSATVTSDCITTNVGGTVYGGGSGSGDVAGPAASVDSEIAIYSGVGGKTLKRFNGSGILVGVSGVATVDSGLQFNTTTKSVGIFGPIVSGQNSTYQGKLQLRGLTSGVSTLSADADGSGMSLDGNLTLTGTLTAGASGAMGLTAIAAPATPAAGTGAVYVDSTSKNLAVKDDAGVVKHGVRTKAAVSNQVLRAIDADGTVTQSALASGDIPNNAANTSGLAGTATALAANGANCSAGSYPLGVDASGAAENCTAVGSSSRVVSAQVSNTDTITAAGTFATTYTLAANYAQYSSIRIRAYGRMTTTATATPLGSFRVKFGAVNVCNAVGTAPAADTSDTNFSWSVECQVTIATTGATGSVYANGYFMRQALSHNGAYAYGLTNAAAVTIDTTSTNVIAIEETQTLVSGQSFTLQQLIVEVN